MLLHEASSKQRVANEGLARRQLHTTNFDRRPLPAPTQSLRHSDCEHRGPDLTIRNWLHQLRFLLTVGDFLLPASLLAHCRAVPSAVGPHTASGCANVSQLLNRVPQTQCDAASVHLKGRASIDSRDRTPTNPCNTSSLLAWIPSPSPCCSTQWQAPNCQTMTQVGLQRSSKFVKSRASPHALLFMWCRPVLRSTLLSLPSSTKLSLRTPPTTVLISPPLAIYKDDRS